MRSPALRLLILAVVLSGLGPVLVRDSPVGPAATAFWRLAIPLPFAYFYGRTAMVPRDRAWALLAGLFLAIDLIFWNTAILRTSVMEATVLVMVFPILVAAGEIGFFRRKLSGNLLAGGLLAFAGTVIIAAGAGRGPSNLTGDLMALAAAVFYAVSMLVTGQLCRRNDPRTVTLWVMLGGAVATLPAALLNSVSVPRSLFGAAYLIFYGIITFASYVLYNRALAMLPTTLVAISGYGQPIIATSLAFVLLGEVPSMTNVLGAGVVISGLFLATYFPGPNRRQPGASA